MGTFFFIKLLFSFILIWLYCYVYILLSRLVCFFNGSFFFFIFVFFAFQHDYSCTNSFKNITEWIHWTMAHRLHLNINRLPMALCAQIESNGKKKKRRRRRWRRTIHSFFIHSIRNYNSVTKWMRYIIEMERKTHVKHEAKEEEEEEMKRNHIQIERLMRMKQKRNTIKWHIHHNLFSNHLTTNKFDSHFFLFSR